MIEVVLIYEFMPDRTQVFNLLVSDEEFAKLKECHGRYGNCAGYEPEVDALLNDWLPNFIEGKPCIFDTSVEEDQPLMHVKGPVIVTGFNL